MKKPVRSAQAQTAALSAGVRDADRVHSAAPDQMPKMRANRPRGSAKPRSMAMALQTGSLI
jgi:hypothetical protein